VVSFCALSSGLVFDYAEVMDSNTWALALGIAIAGVACDRSSGSGEAPGPDPILAVGSTDQVLEVDAPSVSAPTVFADAPAVAAPSGRAAGGDRKETPSAANGYCAIRGSTGVCLKHCYPHPTSPGVCLARPWGQTAPRPPRP
jgi:hypothetical protein